jgi:hypothetical protein
MQSCTAFCEVDLVATEHGLNALWEPAFFRKRNQQFDRFIGDAILRIVQKQTCCFRCQPFAPIWIIGEEPP